MELPDTITTYTRKIMPNLHGWCSPEKAEELARQIIETKARRIVEIGVFAGRSLIAMALAAKRTSGHVIGIDPWDSGASVKGFENDKANAEWWGNCDHNLIFQKCRIYVGLYGVKDNTILIPHTSKEALTLFSQIDLLHIDGNHSEEQSLYDVEHYVPLVRNGGIVVFDDTNWSTTKKAQERLSELCYFTKFVETPGQQCGFYRKKLEPSTFR